MYHPMLPHTTCDTIFVMHLCHGHGDMTLYDTGHGTCVMVSVMCGDEESCHDVTILRPHRSRDGDHDSGHVMETMTQVIWRRPWHRSVYLTETMRSPSNIANNHQYQYLIFVVALRLSILLCDVHMDDAHHDNYPPTWLSPCDSSSGSVCTLCTLRWWDPWTLGPPDLSLVNATLRLNILVVVVNWQYSVRSIWFYSEDPVEGIYRFQLCTFH